jgi:exopolysaccharide biosynthesis protein
MKTICKKQFAVFQLLVSLLSVLCVLCGYALGQDWKTVHDGVEYAQMEREISGLKVKMNLLRLDLTKVRLDVHHALDKAIGLETTSSIAKRKGAVAAINSGFFRLDRSEFAGDAAGVLMVDNYLLSESMNDRVAIFIKNSTFLTEVNFANVNIGDLFRLRKKNVYFTGINRERKAEDLIEYTPAFGPSTLSSLDGIELVVRNQRIVSINDGRGKSEIPIDGFVISASGKYAVQIRSLAKLKSKVRRFTRVTHSMRDGFPSEESRHIDRSFQGAEDITNGVPHLIKNGKIDITWEQEKASKSFVETRHPRTAVAKLKDGKFLMITVDGRSESSGGLSLYDLADYLLSIGAVDAMNLDGGGSTTMFLDGKVVNTPSDKEGERKVGDAIVVTLRRKIK